MLMETEDEVHFELLKNLKLRPCHIDQVQHFPVQSKHWRLIKIVVFLGLFVLLLLARNQSVGITAE